MMIGVVLMENVKWLSFHSGYDFGYLLKILTCQNLPQVPYHTISPSCLCYLLRILTCQKLPQVSYHPPPMLSSCFGYLLKILNCQNLPQVSSHTLPPSSYVERAAV